MPGIVGLVSGMPREQAEFQLRQMLDSICHESFYVSGTSSNEKLGLYVGWVALRGSFSENMPLHNEHGNITLIFSGEEFPDPDTKNGLKKKGHTFDSKGTSYLVHLAEDDVQFPKCLNGRFHGILSESTRGTATLFNDRYGMQRLYYHEAKDAFYFSAEAKAILRVRPELRELDPKGIAEFVACGCVLEDRTLFLEFGFCRQALHGYSKTPIWKRRSLISTRGSGKRNRCLTPRVTTKDFGKCFPKM